MREAQQVYSVQQQLTSDKRAECVMIALGTMLWAASPAPSLQHGACGSILSPTTACAQLISRSTWEDNHAGPQTHTSVALTRTVRVWHI